MNKIPAGREWLEDPHNWDVQDVETEILRTMVERVGKDPNYANERDWFIALAQVLRRPLSRRTVKTQKAQYDRGRKRVYYLSLEFLIGRTSKKVLTDLGLYETFAAAMKNLGQDIDAVIDAEPEPALGNGGLGRLAACFLDSMATHRYPGYGYGIRYDYGMFTQSIRDGQQIEHPEHWLKYGNPWEIPRPDVQHPVHFYGHITQTGQTDDGPHYIWHPGETVLAQAYDLPISGFNANSVVTLRLWSARATQDFDLRHFNQGNYIESVRDKNLTETLSQVLYPMDTTLMGQELRLKQEFFFVAASLQDILIKFRRSSNSWDELPKQVTIQLNDTHPALAIPELMRLLIDEHKLPWSKAWEISTGVFAYTNHTLLPEALETWPIDQMNHVLPRHMQIIYDINHHFLESIRAAGQHDDAAIRAMSIIDDSTRRVRMANLAIIGSYKVNGVAELHTEILRSKVFPEFDNLWKGKFVPVTNGVTPRRWLYKCNEGLRNLIVKEIGDNWVTELEDLKKLEKKAKDKSFQTAFAKVKAENKKRLATMLRDRMSLHVDTDALFDIQIKRIHEYKRQLLNLLQIVDRYNRIRDGMTDDLVPRVAIFGGKAAPGYFTAKKIIRLINDVGNVINNDPVARDWLKIAFLPNYNVSAAEVMIPGADLSEQTSTAGTEASGTGNMKFALNGALTIGTLDGANVEIRDAVGADNIFIFGLTADAAHDLRMQGYNPHAIYETNLALKRVMDMIGDGYFSPGEPDRYHDLLHNLKTVDYFLLLVDFESYVEQQLAVDRLYSDQAKWREKAILNMARMGRFSSDYTIHRYAREIWNIEQLTIT